MNSQLLDIHDNSEEDIVSIFTQFAENLKAAAEETLTNINPKQKQSYIRTETWELIEARDEARRAGNIDEEKNCKKG